MDIISFCYSLFMSTFFRMTFSMKIPLTWSKLGSISSSKALDPAAMRLEEVTDVRPHWDHHAPTRNFKIQVIFFFQSEFLWQTLLAFFVPQFLCEHPNQQKTTYTPQVDLQSQHLGPRARRWSRPDKIPNLFSWWWFQPSWKIHPWSLTKPLKKSAWKTTFPLGTFQGLC